MEIIITYLLEKGGIFGLLFAITLVWIFLREKQIFSKSKPEKEDTEKKDVDKILYVVEDLKSIQIKSQEQITTLGTIMEKMLGYEKAELANVEKLAAQFLLLDPKISDIEKRIQDLWEWHSVKDSDGVPIWYVRRSLEESIDKLELAINALQANVTQVGDVIRSDLENRLQKVNEDRVVELKQVLETYNKTVNDLILALEKIKLLIKSQERN